ncbi:hypothetical protein [Microbacterium sp. Leaf179]|uniref:hypothetical protein n=1 Tax=Microbacterium sp. Leaf179 TaxID=1736288 RepID=UPI0006FFF208|nr:hypothetical protein [Microbacterium sp. Leaf179]KQR88744.1 hypothetical protein ASF96_02955 [Microbacterium sp. Leaf179]
MTDTTWTPTPADIARPRTYTQAELDHQVRERLGAESAEYAATREAAERVDAAAQRIAALEQELTTTRRDALIARLISDHNLTRDDAVLLTGEDEATLTAQAQRLQERAGERQSRGPIARKEGQPVRHTSSTDNRQAFLAELGVADDQAGW